MKKYPTMPRPHREAADLCREKNRLLMAPRSRTLMCATCGKEVRELEYSQCPHYGFCSVDCLPCGQIFCTICYLKEPPPPDKENDPF